MIVTPPSFTPLIARAQGDGVRTFVFRHYDLLVRASDAALPDEATSASLAKDPAAEIPVGLWGGHYCRAIWLPRWSGRWPRPLRITISPGMPA